MPAPRDADEACTVAIEPVRGGHGSEALHSIARSPCSDVHRRGEKRGGAYCTAPGKTETSELPSTFIVGVRTIIIAPGNVKTTRSGPKIAGPALNLPVETTEDGRRSKASGRQNLTFVFRFRFVLEKEKEVL